MEWNFNINEAPKGEIKNIDRNIEDKNGDPTYKDVFFPEYIWAATKCGQVTKTNWLPKEGRWNCLSRGEYPIAWQAFVVPEFPSFDCK